MGKTIIFDLGGVLVNLDWDSVCGKLQENSGLGDVRPEIVNGPIVVSAMLGRITPCIYHETLCEKLVCNLSYEQFVDIWNGLLSANEAIVPLVERLKSDHRLVLGSNTDPIHFAYSIERFPVLKSFEQFFLSHEMGLLKPDPAVFRYVLRSLDAPAAECIFIDDRAENVAAALSVGITAICYVSVGQLEDDLSSVF